MKHNLLRALYVCALSALFVAAPAFAEDASSGWARFSAMESPAWAREAVIYAVDLRSFSEEGKFHSLEARLDSLKKYGVNCLLLLPIFPTGETARENKADPSEPRDYSGINLEYGTKDGFRSFVQAAHELNFKVILDWPALRTAQNHAWVQAHPEWYIKGSSSTLDYSHKDVRKAMSDAMAQWVRDYEVDGFYCRDADKLPLDFWIQARREISSQRASIRSTALMLGGARPENHLASFDVTDATGLYHAFMEIAQGRADADAVRRWLDEERASYPQGALHRMFTEHQDTPRAIEALGLAHAPAALLCWTLGGIPSLLSGQEVGASEKISLMEKRVIDWKGAAQKHPNAPKLYKRLASIRKKHVSMTRGQRFSVKTSDDRSVLAFARSYRGDAFLAAVNLSPKPVSITLELPEICLSDTGKLKVKPVFNGGPLRLEQGLSASVSLPAWGYQIWIVQ